MGQYYAIYNKTKKEYYSTHSLNSGCKLLELGFSLPSTVLCILLANSNGRGGGDLLANYDYSDNKKKTATKDIEQIAGRWIGDVVVIQGDYARDGDKHYIQKDELNEYKDISNLIIKAISHNDYIKEQLNNKE